MIAECATRVWTRPEWRVRLAAHRQRVDVRAAAFVERRSRAVKHPVDDFLFTYYSFSPAKLVQWVPPGGVALEVEPADLEELPWLAAPRFELANGCLRLSGKPTEAQRGLALWVAELCTRVAERSPRFACYGLHEWAMVYRQSREQVRHQGWELRLGPEELAAFVESRSLCCTHYDAFRFFTPEARPRNSLQPVLDTRLELEQGGCLHANMDLYKWSAKLWPWVGSDLVGECFEFAAAARDLDMRASPYDLRHLGYAPVCIETAEGRAEYEAMQRQLAARAAPLRDHLRRAAEELARA